MRSVLNRRTVLHGALGVAVAAAVRPALTQVPAGHDLYVLSGVGGNVVVVKTSDGAVLVDSGMTGKNGQVFDFVEASTGGRRVHTLFNTHWHLEQIGGNEAIGAAGANIVAHEKTRLRLAVGYYLPTDDRYTAPIAVKAQPTESFYTTGSTSIGGRRIEYGIARNLVVGIELELAADGDVLGESHAALSVFYNALRETPGAPALSINLEVGQPTAAALLSEVAATLTGIATRSIGRSRVQANVALTAGASDESSWFAGVALDHTLFRTSTLVGAELLAADRAATGGSRWALGAGLRRQLAPTLVLQAGIRRWLDGDPGANEITLGLSHAFAIAGLMPGRSTR
jgi:hypothetical protein